ncbi:unnamed protein product [Pleuronectes platessa]|uniref:Uncharacterized protein n=1 Tax=Pleuronectes platessa TaxID=8262 RepID=A0A9N7VSR6_PLEPL|nr:unnamed protein product [Pleuronectes platessa]
MTIVTVSSAPTLASAPASALSSSLSWQLGEALRDARARLLMHLGHKEAQCRAEEAQCRSQAAEPQSLSQTARQPQLTFPPFQMGCGAQGGLRSGQTDPGILRGSEGEKNGAEILFLSPAPCSS